MSPRKPRKGRPQPKNPNRSAVLGMIERGGKLRLVPVADEKFVILAPVMRDNIDKDALLQTDKAVVFEKVGHYLDFRGHRMGDHIISMPRGRTTRTRLRMLSPCSSAACMARSTRFR